MIHTERYKIDRTQACERCAFSTGEHASFCAAADETRISTDTAEIDQEINLTEEDRRQGKY